MRAAILYSFNEPFAVEDVELAPPFFTKCPRSPTRRRSLRRATTHSPVRNSRSLAVRALPVITSSSAG